MPSEVEEAEVPNSTEIALHALLSVRQGLQMMDSGLEILAALLAEGLPEIFVPDGDDVPAAYAEREPEEEPQPRYLEAVLRAPLYYASGGYATGTVGIVGALLEKGDLYYAHGADRQQLMDAHDVYDAMTRVADGEGAIFVETGGGSEVVRWDA